MTMIPTQLSQKELDLVLNYRQGLYKIDISQEEYDLICRFRNLDQSPARKYLANVEKLMFDEEDLIKKCSQTLKDFGEALLLGNITPAEYNSRPYFKFENQSKHVNDKVDNLNYLRDQILIHFENKE
jgi:hypothetical protein